MCSLPGKRSINSSAIRVTENKCARDHYFTEKEYVCLATTLKHCAMCVVGMTAKKYPGTKISRHSIFFLLPPVIKKTHYASSWPVSSVLLCYIIDKTLSNHVKSFWYKYCQNDAKIYPRNKYLKA